MRGIGSMAFHGNNEEVVAVDVEWVADIVSGALVNDDKLMEDRTHSLQR